MIVQGADGAAGLLAGRRTWRMTHMRRHQTPQGGPLIASSAAWLRGLRVESTAVSFLALYRRWSGPIVLNAACCGAAAARPTQLEIVVVIGEIDHCCRRRSYMARSGSGASTGMAGGAGGHLERPAAVMAAPPHARFECHCRLGDAGPDAGLGPVATNPPCWGSRRQLAAPPHAQLPPPAVR